MTTDRGPQTSMDTRDSDGVAAGAVRSALPPEDWRVGTLREDVKFWRDEYDRKCREADWLWLIVLLAPPLCGIAYLVGLMVGMAAH